MDELKKLQSLSHVSRVCNQLQKHLGTNDKVLAEYLIHLAKQNDSIDTFRSAINTLCDGESLPDILTKEIYQLVASTPQTKRGDESKTPARRPKALERDHGGFLGSGIDRELIIRKSHQEQESIFVKTLQNSPSGQASHQLQPSISDPKPQDIRPNVILAGTVRSIKDYGAFITLGTKSYSPQGLAHISQIDQTGQRLSHPSDKLREGQKVYVKVLSIAGDKIRLSLRGVNQTEVYIPNPQTSSLQKESDATTRYNSSISGIPQSFITDGSKGPKNSKRLRKHIPDSEQWELTQLSKSLPRNQLRRHGNPDELTGIEEDEDYQGRTESTHILLGDEDTVTKESTEIELNEAEPAFLQNSDAAAGSSRTQP